MKKTITILLTICFIIIGICIYNYLRIKYAKIEVTLKEELTIPFLEEKKVSDFIISINGKIIDDFIINSKELGEKEVTFSFINDDNIKVKYTFKVNIVDITEPTIWIGDNYNVTLGSDINLEEKILCGDNYDNNPKCYIEGEYDLNQPGVYPLTFKAIDSSGNEEEKTFNLNVYEPSSDTEINYEVNSIAFSDIIKKYKSSKTKIGLDISSYQGDVDFKKLKESGVEFIIIRVGFGYDNKNFIDNKFKEYIKSANENNIDVGVYYYSYATNIEEVKKQAKWVVKQLKNYKVSLPIAYDWEEWSNFNDYHLSFFGLTNLAEEFLSIIEKNGYKGMLYSSKIYLEKIWLKTKYPIWLAQYNDQVTYNGEYKIWQLCDTGIVDGINGFVDIDIMYD